MREMAGHLLPLCPSGLGLRNRCVGYVRLVPKRGGNCLVSLEHHCKKAYWVVREELAAELYGVTPILVRKSLNWEPKGLWKGVDGVLCDDPWLRWCWTTCSLWKASRSEHRSPSELGKGTWNLPTSWEASRLLGHPGRLGLLLLQPGTRSGSPRIPKDSHTWLLHIPGCQVRRSPQKF